MLSLSSIICYSLVFIKVIVKNKKYNKKYYYQKNYFNTKKNDS